MQKQRLFERWTQIPNEEYNANQEQEKAQLVRSVAHHICQLLNTTQGTVLIDKEYGVPSFSSLAKNLSNKQREELQESIYQSIQRYETRLEILEIQWGKVSKKELSVDLNILARQVGDTEEIEIPLSFYPDGVVKSYLN